MKVETLQSNSLRGKSSQRSSGNSRVKRSSPGCKHRSTGAPNSKRYTPGIAQPTQPFLCLTTARTRYLEVEPLIVSRQKRLNWRKPFLYLLHAFINLVPTPTRNNLQRMSHPTGPTTPHPSCSPVALLRWLGNK